MDLKEYWAKPEIKVNSPPKYKPIWCACGKSFIGNHALKMHVKRFGRKDHGYKPSPMMVALDYLSRIDESECSLDAWNLICNAIDRLTPEEQ